MKIEAVSGWEAGNYDPRTCNNGGGYWQYSGWCKFANGVTVEVEDTSCGDFGTRTYTRLWMPDGAVYRVNYGTMDDYAIDSDEYIAECAGSIWGIYGLDMVELQNEADAAINRAAWADYDQRCEMWEHED